MPDCKLSLFFPFLPGWQNDTALATILGKKRRYKSDEIQDSSVIYWLLVAIYLALEIFLTFIRIKCSGEKSWCFQFVFSVNEFIFFLMLVQFVLFQNHSFLRQLRSDLLKKIQLFEMVIWSSFLVISLPATLISFTKLRFCWSFWDA